MTNENQAEWRRGFEILVRESLRETADVDITKWGPTVSSGGWSHFMQVEVSSAAEDLEEPPPLTTAQQLALSVLLGEPVPLADLMAACEDAGVYPAGVLDEVRRLAQAEERERIAAVCRERAEFWKEGGGRNGGLRFCEGRAMEADAIVRSVVNASGCVQDVTPSGPPPP